MSVRTMRDAYTDAVITATVEYIAEHRATTRPEAWQTKRDRPFAPGSTEERARRVDAKHRLMSEIRDAIERPEGL